MSRHIRGRIWHPSQQIEERPDGGLLLRLTVSNHWALRSWILGFGALARVVAPLTSPTQILEEVERTRVGIARGPDVSARNSTAVWYEWWDEAQSWIDNQSCGRRVPFQGSPVSAAPGAHAVSLPYLAQMDAAPVLPRILAETAPPPKTSGETR